VTRVQTSLGACHLAIIWLHNLTAGWAEEIREQLWVLLLLLVVVVQAKGTNGSSQTMLIRAMQARAEASALCSRLEPR
jgi:hypothetical protein